MPTQRYHVARTRLSNRMVGILCSGLICVLTTSIAGCAAVGSSSGLDHLSAVSDTPLQGAHLASTALKLQGTLTPSVAKAGANAVRKVTKIPQDGCHVLALSGGGPDGAYGAGVLAGWSASGGRPQFSAVTGVSIGALIAPFAFVGPAKDGALRRALTGPHIDSLISQPDPLGLILGESAYANANIEALIENNVTDQLLTEIAAHHRAGRRLLVATANLDTEQLAIWDMGHIAASGDQAAKRLFRRILLAAASVPGALPAVPIETLDADGRLTRSLHADAGAMLHIYIDPDMIMRQLDPRKTGQRCYYHAIVNNHLAPTPSRTAPKATVVALRAISSMIKTHTLQTLDRAAETIRRRGDVLRVTYLDPGWQVVGGLDFNRDYMAALYVRAVARGQDGSAWTEDLPR